MMMTRKVEKMPLLCENLISESLEWRACTLSVSLNSMKESINQSGIASFPQPRIVCGSVSMLFLLGEIPQRVHTMSGLGGLAEAEASDGLLACSSEVIRRTTAQQAVREMIGRPCEHRRTFRCILMAAAAMAGEQSTIASVPFRSVPQYRGPLVGVQS
ncbi:hypothetical protein MPTK1_6g15490 [Marchantia polymorpha subsp. ruderalis]|uniref:Uncharacterized protein n=2 Tax=Marchantia polymorpha TaxID=3197 RepID=A0AAF6BSD1_MARPO|nr:hypothetical protein MARPO_0056s0061 [Marchantia polymorpha]BBN14915.1 hypothetical protein Mp_6g15490 [Marchantia polymorpha subsp. ruderalis]|eukprot:PTQ37599.1 hypothetical protein MARPO_0056s0061 [Marchantia polymorpha]